MTTTLTRRPAAARTGRKLLVLTHVAFTLGWLGVTSTFLVLTLWLTGVRDPAVLAAGYGVHELVVTWLARPAAIGTALTGLLLVMTSSARRPGWWMWWVPAKFVLVVATVLITAPTSPGLLAFVVGSAEQVGTPAYTAAQQALVWLAVLHVAVITVAGLLTVFRPGRRFRRPRPSSTVERSI